MIFVCRDLVVMRRGVRFCRAFVVRNGLRGKELDVLSALSVLVASEDTVSGSIFGANFGISV
jgi:hypothetical protein